MANKQYTYTTPENYTYDSDKIEIVDGIVKLKKDLTNVYAHYHLNEGTGEIVLDSSGNGRNGTPVNNPISVVGKLNNCLSFNGSNQYVNCGDIASFEYDDIFSFEAWLNTSENVSGRIIVSKVYSSGTYRGVLFQMDKTGHIIFTLCNSYGGGLYLQVKTQTSGLNDGNWHHIIITYDGSHLANGVHIYVDSLNDSPLTIIKDTLGTNTVINTLNFQISGREGIDTIWNGKIDEIVIYNKELTQEEVTYRYNSGNGREGNYPIDKPTIKPTTSWEVSGLSEFFGFAETLGAENEGNIGYQLSDDDGVNYRYYNGASWVVTSSQYNSAEVVGANIDKFPTTDEKILFKSFLISDGEQKVELDTIEITATVGYPPNVYAGADKECYDHETKKPFLDAVIEDPDGDIEQSSAWVKIGDNDWVKIEKGEWGTFQEAIRNWQYQFKITE